MKNIKLKMSQDKTTIELIVENVNQISKIVKVAKRWQDDGYVVMISFPWGFEEFHEKLGRHYANTVDTKQRIFGIADIEAYKLVAKVILQETLQNTYYMKSEEEKAIYEIRRADNQG